MTLKRDKTLEQQISLVPKKEMQPLEDAAVIKLASYSKNVAEYTELVEALGLKEALCRSSGQQTNNSPPVAM